MLEKVSGTGTASVFRGDPRMPETDFDSWVQTILSFQRPEILRRAHLYGSDAGFCARRNSLLEHNDVLDGNVNAAGTAYMKIGSALEDLLADSLARSGRLLAHNIYLVDAKGLKVRGKIDFIIQDQEDRLALVECKSCGELPIEPKPVHLWQIQTYAAYSGIHRCYLTYVSRNLKPLQPIAIRTFIVDTSKEALLERLKIAFLSRLSSDSKRLVPVPISFRKHTECHYCEFRDYFCYLARKGMKEDVSVIPTLPDGLEELSPSEYIEMESEALVLAEDFYSRSGERRQETIKELLFSLTKDSIAFAPLLKRELGV